MINKILIANRGEIACRVIRSAKKLGISTVAVYSNVDQHAQHVKMADQAVCLGEAVAAKSYLNGDLIIQKALSLGVDAIHPGYGFLSENAAFADKCLQNNIIFIGPKTTAIRAMGSKSAAKTIMGDANVPLVPGYHGNNQDPEFLHKQALEMGYPVLLKAAAGGGGKGMRQVWKDSQFTEALHAAKREAMNSFSDDIMLIEKYLTEPRHVEIQVFCDNHGNGVYLFERDCSIQRRHQKIIEEAPAPGLTQDIREEMGQAALKAAFAIDYTGAGTVEFLLDADGSFYFMEMNTRLQVEHPVTEFITGEDLVEWQIAVANNQILPKTQEQLTLHGHAIEARIYAEDPNNEFLPSTGTLHALREPLTNEFVRIDSGVVAGDEVSIYYDPMIAKLIVWGENREQALGKLLQSLKQYMICGVTTNIPYLIKVAQSVPFKEAQLSTDFIERHASCLNMQQTDDLLANQQLIAICALLSAPPVPKTLSIDNHQADFAGFRLNHVLSQQVEFSVDNKEYSLHQNQLSENQWCVTIKDETTHYKAIKKAENIEVETDNNIAVYPYFEHAGVFYMLAVNGLVTIIPKLIDLGTQGESAHAGDILAPMNGTLVSMQVNQGQQVQKDDLLAIVEAMKMEHSLRAPFAGTVTECFASAGELVDGGEILISLAPIADES